MPFCPKCRYEYEPNVTECPDCNVALVTSLPQNEETGYPFDGSLDDDWVRIGRLTSEHYAHMLIEALKAKDIPAVINSGVGYFGATGQMGISSFLPVGGGYSILVPRQFSEQANTEASVLLGDQWISSKVE